MAKVALKLGLGKPSIRARVTPARARNKTLESNGTEGLENEWKGSEPN